MMCSFTILPAVMHVTSRHGAISVSQNLPSANITVVLWDAGEEIYSAHVLRGDKYVDTEMFPNEGMDWAN